MSENEVSLIDWSKVPELPHVSYQNIQPEFYLRRHIQLQSFDYEGSGIDEPSNYQKKLIQDTWQAIGETQDKYGIHIFHEIFKMNDGIRDVFRIQKGISLQELRQDPGLAMHAAKFMDFVTLAVEHIHKLKNYVGIVFICLGLKHKILHQIRGLTGDLFTVFVNSMIRVWKDQLKDHFTPEVEAAWQKLFLFISAHIQHGYNVAGKTYKTKEEEASRVVFH